VITQPSFGIGYIFFNITTMARKAPPPMKSQYTAAPTDYELKSVGFPFTCTPF
jgi:hypothetical protein